MVRSSTQAPQRGQDFAYILFSGFRAGDGGHTQDRPCVRQGTGKSVDGLPLRILGTVKEPDVDLVRKIIALDEEAERLSPGSSERMVASSVVVDGAPICVATVHTDERNPWAVRGLIPRHLANVDHDGNACARRPG